MESSSKRSHETGDSKSDEDITNSNKNVLKKKATGNIKYKVHFSKDWEKKVPYTKRKKR